MPVAQATVALPVTRGKIPCIRCICKLQKVDGKLVQADVPLCALRHALLCFVVQLRQWQPPR